MKSLRHMLKRPELADLVIPDLARWEDWEVRTQLCDLFIQADENSSWVRVPVVNYLRACPLPAAEKALEKLEKVDPESVRRANTFFAVPTPKEPAEAKSSSIDREDETKLSGLISPHSPRFIDSKSLIVPVTPWTANPWRMAGVLAMAFSTILIANFLLLTGGSQPVAVSSDA